MGRYQPETKFWLLLRLGVAIGLALGSFLLFTVVKVAVRNGAAAGALPVWAAILATGTALAALRTGQTLARKLSKLRAHEALEQDDRAPILFLRSFRADGRFRVRHPFFSWRAVGFGWWVPLELALTLELNDIGPTVAIGRPGERLPPEGAARYRGHDDWQASVRELVEESQFIVVVLGDTPNLHWEYEVVLEQQALSKTVFVVPPGSRRASARRISHLLPLLQAADVHLDLAPCPDTVAIVGGTGSRARIVACPTARRWWAVLPPAGFWTRPLSLAISLAQRGARDRERPLSQPLSPPTAPGTARVPPELIMTSASAAVHVRRSCAFAFDLMLGVVAAAVLTLPFLAVWWPEVFERIGSPSETEDDKSVQLVCSMTGWLTYTLATEGIWGRGLGKKILGLEVRTDELIPLPKSRRLLRALAKVLALASCCGGLLFVLPYGSTSLLDMLLRTRVVRVRRDND